MSDESENDDFLPEQTISLRKALSYCNNAWERLQRQRWNGNDQGKNQSIDGIYSSKSLKETTNRALIEDAKAAALSVPGQRRDALRNFHSSEEGSKLDVVQFSSDKAPLTDLEFRRRYQIGNIPCILRGMNQTPSYSKIWSLWRDETSPPVSNKSVVNREWFFQTLGGMRKVPVRFQPQAPEGTLDENGRAVECATKEMSLEEWTDLLDLPQKSQYTPKDYYLKDWHLQSIIRKLDKADHEPLYQVPPFFQHDLLNDFLMKFTEHGDYMFTYWGPKGSRTTLHSDVLNSYSWSFNVAGAKEWKFFPPKLPQEGTISDPQKNESEESTVEPLVVIQHPGECIFVACGWQHEVTNLGVETISINHNWITTANIDRVWECLTWEMQAIETEMKAWDMSEECWDAKESMLRGCVGLNVSGFFFMVATRLLDVLEETTSDSPIHDVDEDELWQRAFDLIRLQEALLVLTRKEKLGLRKRLAAVLYSRKLAENAMELAEWGVSAVDKLFKKM